MPNPTILHTEDLPGGGLWSYRLRRHHTLRITALGAGANASLIVIHADEPSERLNVPDTLKAQHTARLTRGHLLMGDMGRALLSITQDSCGWHDPLGGHDNPGILREKFGSRTYQEARNEWFRNARDNFLVELGKRGFGERDLVACVNFFSRLDVDDEGRLAFHPGNAAAGMSVDLRAELNVYVFLTTCPHPLDPRTIWEPAPVRLSILKTPPPGADDYCHNFRPENGRSMALSELFHA